MRLRWLCVLMAFAILLFNGCQIETGRQRQGSYSSAPPTASSRQNVQPAPRSLPPVNPSAQPPTPSQPVGPVRRQLPQITGEPRLGVLLSQAPEVRFTLARGGTLRYGNERYAIPAGELRVRATGKGLVTSATGAALCGNRVAIEIPPSANGPTFSATLDSPIGKDQTLSFSGQPEVALDPASRKAMLIERVGLETYLRGVLPTEISPNWPFEAIKAQAVVARSYTLDRYLTRFDQPWQLHWHYTVDMAYGGLKQLNDRMAVALDQSRGQLIVTGGLPVPALFHACSGGRTESAHNFRPNLTGADNVTDMTATMPSVEDPAAIPGAMALGMQDTHVAWRAQIPIAKITDALQRWTANHPEDRNKFGTVVTVRSGKRFTDSGRVATVMIRHLVNNREIDTEYNAANFRLAVGPGLIRSTNWTRCVHASANGGTLVIEGRGFGHGVGMSQVSAYHLAKTGTPAVDIISQFYPGSKLVKWW